MSVPRRPLLAATIEHPDELANLQLPIWLSEKKNGIRGITDGKGVLSRYLKRIRNKWINLLLSDLPAGIEGEIVCRDVFGNDYDDLEDTNSAVMSVEGKPEFTFYVFDWFDSKFETYRSRNKKLRCHFHTFPEDVEIILQHDCRKISEIKYWYKHYVNAGAEGVMLRDPNGFYKFGRSTLDEELLIKYKPWNDDEAVAIDVLEEMENQNLQLKDNRGLSKRSKHIANLQGKGTMGALLCKNKRFGEFRLGSGFDDITAQWVWDFYLRHGLEAFKKAKQKLHYRYRGITKYGKPRHAAFVSWI